MDTRDGLRTGNVNSVAHAHDGQTVYSTIEGADLVAASRVVDRTAEVGANGTAGMRSVLYRTDGGPAGVAVSDEVWVHSRFERTVNRIDSRSLAPPSEVLEVAELLDAERVVALGDSVLDDEVRLARALFYSTYDRRMTLGGVSCATCHVDGRSDGLSWAVSTGTWQTPSLAGGIGDTQPFTWSEAVASIGAEAELTAVVRMGGTGLSFEDQQSVAALIESVRAPVTPDSDPADVAAGREVFEQAKCDGCHMGDALTDGEHHVLFTSTPLNTPSLRGIGSTATYLHNGQSMTLRDLLEDSKGIMGAPELLSGTDLELLETYLRSL